MNTKILSSNKINRLVLLGAAAFLVSGFFIANSALAATAPNLGEAATFGVLSSTFTPNGGVTAITGDLGYTTLSAGTFTVSGATHTDISGTPAGAIYKQAGLDQGAALNNAVDGLNTQACTAIGDTLDAVVIGANLPGTFPPGCYSVIGAMDITSGTTVTLDATATGGTGNVWIFRSTGALTTGASTAGFPSVVLVNGASASNVFWAPVGAATLGANFELSATPTFVGNILDAANISLGHWANLSGRALAFGGTVTTDADTITVPTSVLTITASAGANGSISPSGAVSVTSGADQSFTIAPNGGFHVADVIVDGASIGAATSFTFPNVIIDHTISASFTANAPTTGPVFIDTDLSGTPTVGDQFFTTIQAAVNAASAGNTIDVTSGTYNESVLVNKPLTIVGVGATNITGVSSANYIVKVDGVTTGPVTLDNLNVDSQISAPGSGTFTDGILINNSGTVVNPIEIKNSTVTNVWSGTDNTSGIEVKASSYALIDYDTISSFFKNGIKFITSNGIVHDNEVIGHDVNGTDSVQNLINLWSGSHVEIYANKLHNALTTGSTPTWDSTGILVSAYNGADSNVPSQANIHDNEIYADDTGIVVGSAYAAGGHEPGTPSGSDTSSATITNNNLHNLDRGVNFEQGTVTATITGNSFSSISGFAVDAHISCISTDSTNPTCNTDTGEPNVPTTPAVTASTITNLTHNYWGTAVLATIQSLVYPNIAVTPYYVNSGKTILSDAALTTVYVDGTYTDVSAGSHTFGYDAFAKIQDGIDAVSSGGTVNVAAGTYNEVITINKPLTLNGAQAGIDARGRTASESIIPAQGGGSSAISITANNVTIDGFTIQGAGTAGLQTWGINAAAGTSTSGVHITNTIFQNLFEGLHVQGPDTNVSSHMTVDKNAFFDDSGDIYAKDAGIWMASAPSNNLTITNNSFSNHDRGDGGDYAAVNIDKSTNLVITGNTSHNDGTFVVLVNDTTVTVSGNSSTNSGTGFNQSSLIFLALGNNGVTIQNNSLDNGYRGVRLSTAFGTGLNQHIQVLNNTITNMVDAGILVPVGTISDQVVVTGNQITGNPIGVKNDNVSLVVDAANNWWGTTSYATVSAQVSNNVSFRPYCATSDCTTSYLFPLTVTGISASNKVYDRTTNASFTGTAALVGVVGSDNVTLGGTPIATFADKTAANGKTVTVTGYTLAGTNADNYTLTQPTLTANITKKGFFVTGTTASNKVYDGNTTAVLNLNSAILGGIIGGSDGGDSVTFNMTGATGTFADKNVGTGKIVNISGFSLTGPDASNYFFTPQTTTADITPVALAVAADSKTKDYGSDDPALTYAFSPALIGGDSFSGALNRATGESAGTYAIDQGTLSAGSDYNIAFTPGTLTVLNSFVLAATTNTNGSLSATTTDAVAASTNSNGIDVSVDIPADVMVTGPATWDGIVNMPTATTATVTISGSDTTVASAIAIGSNNSDLTFDKAVKLTFADQAGKLVGWYNHAGAFTSIAACSAINAGPFDQTWADNDANLAVGADCTFDSGNDLIVWTKHFSTFVTYTESPWSIASGGSGGTGGGIPSFIPPTTPTPTVTPVVGQVLGAATFNFAADLKIGSQGGDVTELQNRLTQEGVYSGPITGYFGQLTLKAVKAYQTKYGISQIGTVGPLTRAQLNGSQVAGASTVNSDAVKAQIAALQAQITSLLQQLVQALQAQVNQHK